MRFAIRGFLILVSAAAGLYDASEGQEASYMAGVLLFAAFAAAEHFGTRKQLKLALQVLQVICSFWLLERFGPSLLFLSLSSLLGYLNSFDLQRRMLLACHLILLNVALGGEVSIALVNANLAFLLTSALFLRLTKVEHERATDVMHYDELRRRHFELDEARERLTAFASRVEEKAQEEERVRIARKLHDDIGHRLIRIKMMMEAALHILPQEPERGSSMLEQIRQQLEDSMEEIRLSVKKVSPATRAEREYALDQLLEETGRETGLETAYRLEGIPYALYPSYRVVLYQNAREALTNALRHGQADWATLTLRYRPRSIEMELRSGRHDHVK